MTMSDLFCLICDINLDISSCVNIFYTSFPRNAELLVNFVSRVLRVAISELSGSYICTQCYNLFQMLEQAQRTVTNIRCEILKIYRSSERRKSIKQILTNNVDLTTNLNSNGVFEENKLDASVQNDQPKEKVDLNSPRVEQTLKQKCIQNKIIGENLNNSNIETLASKIVDDTKVIKKRINNSDNLSNTKSFDYNNTHVDVKANENLKNEIFNNSIALSNDNNVYSIATLQDKDVQCSQKCKICNKLFKTTNEYNNHILKHSNVQSYQCQKCKEKFSDITLANIHALKMHVEEGNYNVTISDFEKGESKDFIKADSVFTDDKLQIQNITQSINFTWKEIEEKVTEVKENSENHAGTEIDQMTIPLNTGKTSKYNLKPLKYTCSTCGKKWKTSTELKTHVKTHSTLRPYMCEKCGQAYKHKHALEIHVGMHNGVNPFQCNFCKKCFTQKGALMRHLPMHTGETPYQCELCGKRFIHHTSYNMHRLSHTGKKSYKCQMCDLSLLSTSHLKRHMRVHTGEKPYSCSLCGKRFAERYNLFAHQKVHDSSESKTKKGKEVPFRCDQCNLIFEKKETLDSHMKHHIVNNELDFKKPSEIFEVESKPDERLKNIELEENTMTQTLIQTNRSKLEGIDNQAKFVFLQNPLSEIDEGSFAVTFGDHKMALESTNYNTSLQVIIESSGASILSNNHLSIDKTL